MRLPLTLLALAVSAAPALAQDSAANGSTASQAASEAAAALTESGVQTVVGAAAVPASVAVGGSGVAASAAVAGGAVSVAAADGMSDAAGASAQYASDGPIVVDDAVVVADPAPHVPYDTKAAPQ